MSRISTGRRAVRISTSLANEINEHARNLHSYAVAFTSVTIGLVILMWLLNSYVTYGRGFVFPIAIISVTFTSYVLLHPKFLFWAVGLGALVEGLNDRDITQGAIVGLNTYFRIVSAVLFFFTGSAVVLAIIPFSGAPSVFWGFALIIVSVSTFFTYMNISIGEWKRRIVVTAATILCVTLAIQLFLPSGVLAWFESNYNALDRAAGVRAEQIEFCTQHPKDPICNTSDTTSVRLEARAWNPKEFTFLPDKWREIRIPKGYGSCYDNINMVEFRRDSDAATNYVRSSNGTTVVVDVYLRPHGTSSCNIPKK